MMRVSQVISRQVKACYSNRIMFFCNYIKEDLW